MSPAHATEPFELKPKFLLCDVPTTRNWSELCDNTRKFDRTRNSMSFLKSEQ
jgi:hypothetical protein